MHTYIYTHTNTHLNTYIHTYTDMHIHISHTHTQRHTYLYTCIHTQRNVYLCRHTYTLIYPHRDTRTYTHTYTHAHRDMQTHRHALTHRHAYTHVRTDAQVYPPCGSPEPPHLLCCWPPCGLSGVGCLVWVGLHAGLVFLQIIKSVLWKWLSALQRASAVVSVCIVSVWSGGEAGPPGEPSGVSQLLRVERQLAGLALETRHPGAARGGPSGATAAGGP